MRNKPIVIDTIDGASATQKVLDDMEWVSQSGNPVAYATHIRRSPLDGMSPKPVSSNSRRVTERCQIQRHPRTLGPATVRIARRTSGTISTSHTDPHTFLTLGVGVTPGLQTQHQIGTFLPTGVTVDPDGLLPQFEVPINGPLPEELNF